MIPLATAELATDAWIQSLMRPIMGANLAAWAIVLSAGIMMILRFFAGVPLKIMSPPQLRSGLYGCHQSGWLFGVDLQ